MKQFKLKSVVLILALFAGVTFSSCSDNMDDLTTNAQAPKTNFSTSVAYYQNPNNPQDSVGYYHNQLLMYFDKESVSRNVTAQASLNMTKNYYAGVYGQEKSDQVISL